MYLQDGYVYTYCTHTQKFVHIYAVSEVTAGLSTVHGLGIAMVNDWSNEGMDGLKESFNTNGSMLGSCHFECG